MVAATTTTATLAASSVQPKLVHAGVNAITVSGNRGGVNVTAAQATIMLLGKLPPGVRVLGLQGDVGEPSTGTYQFGVMNAGTMTTLGTAHVAASVDAINVIGNWGYETTGSASATAERFVAARVLPGTTTTSIVATVTVYYEKL